MFQFTVQNQKLSVEHNNKIIQHVFVLYIKGVSFLECICFFYAVNNMAS